jgi:hypothetical protein
MSMVRKVLRLWGTPYAGSTWRRFGYALLGLPVGVAGLVLVAVGRAGTAARWQVRLGERLADLPAVEPRTQGLAGRVAVQSVVTAVVSAASWLVLQYTAFILLINVAYPWRDYLIAHNHAGNAPPVPWLDFSIHQPPHPEDIWASTYHGAWGGPTLAGAWSVHAALTLLVFYPIVAWLVRALVRLQRGTTTRLLGT